MQTMIVTETKNQSAGKFAWFAARDAHMRSLVNSQNHKDVTKIQAERMKMVLEHVYYMEKSTLTFCKKWIRVKAHNAQTKNKKLLAELETEWAVLGITKKITPQGVIYNVPAAK